jgi:hypothetical protein
MAAKRGGSASSNLTALVLATYGTLCHLRLDVCTRVATTKDHLIPYSHGGDDSLENLRPACNKCNSKRQNKSLGGAYGASIVVVIGPPASGKNTYIEAHASRSDIIIDLDAIARAIMPIQPSSTHTYPLHVRHVAIGARKAAIERALRLKERCTVWLIHAVPTVDQLAEYRRMRYRVVVVDPGRAIVEPRAHAERPPVMLAGVARWYDTYPEQSGHGVTELPSLEASPAPIVDALAVAPSRQW